MHYSSVRDVCECIKKKLPVSRQPFLERRGDWTYCALAIRHLCQEDAGNYAVSVRNKYGEKTNHVRLSMKDPNEPQKSVEVPNKLLLTSLKNVPFFSHSGSLAASSPRSSASPRPAKRATSSTWSARSRPCPGRTSSGSSATRKSWRGRDSLSSGRCSHQIRTFTSSGSPLR